MEEEIIGEGVELKAKFFFLREKGGGQKRENGRGKKFQFPLSMKLKLEARALALSRGKHSNIEKRIQEKRYKNFFQRATKLATRESEHGPSFNLAQALL